MLNAMKFVFDLVVAIILVIGLYFLTTEIAGLFTGVSGQTARETLFLTVKYYTVGLSLTEQVKYTAYTYLLA